MANIIVSIKFRGANRVFPIDFNRIPNSIGGGIELEEGLSP